MSEGSHPDAAASGAQGRHRPHGCRDRGPAADRTRRQQVEAARRLGKSLETVRKQTKLARARLSARTNAQAVAIAVSLDLI